MSVHAFVDSGDVRVDARGRRLRVCATCGGVRVGTGHSTTKGVNPVPLPPLPRKHKALPARELRMLALALDAVIELPMDVAGWGIMLRAMDLRKQLPIPRDPGAPPPTEQEPKPRVVSDSQPIVPEYLSGPVRSRAKVATKAIRDPKMREVATRAVAQGWQLSATKSGHWRLDMGRSHIIFPKTPSDHRSWLNMRASAKRHGIDVSDV